ncbi:MAG: hypothetical protein ACOYXT_07885, partial [Bacteroidota bacterium]
MTWFLVALPGGIKLMGNPFAKIYVQHLSKSCMENLYRISALGVLLFLSQSSAADGYLREDTKVVSNITPAVTSFVSKPYHGAVNVSPFDLKVTANVAEGATRYTIELNTKPDFTGVSFIKTSAKDHERTLIFTGLRYTTTYYTRVSTNVSGYGKTTQFTTWAEEFPSLAEPANGAAEQSANVIRVVVDPVAGARRYTVQLSATTDFSGSMMTLRSVE